MTIEYIELAKQIAKNTPAPTNAAEWSIYGILIATFAIMLAASWAYFLWREKQTILRQEKATLVAEKMTATLDRLIIYFDQNNLKEDIQTVKTNIALIHQKLDK